MFSVIRKYEGGIASNRLSPWNGEYYTGSSTHRPSRGGIGRQLTQVGDFVDYFYMGDDVLSNIWVL